MRPGGRAGPSIGSFVASSARGRERGPGRSAPYRARESWDARDLPPLPPAGGAGTCMIDPISRLRESVGVRVICPLSRLRERVGVRAQWLVEGVARARLFAAGCVVRALIRPSGTSPASGRRERRCCSGRGRRESGKFLAQARIKECAVWAGAVLPAPAAWATMAVLRASGPSRPVPSAGADDSSPRW